MINHLARVNFYTANLEEALRFYQSLGLHLKRELKLRKGHRALELAFAHDQTKLLLHNDPLMQFTDVTLEVADVRETYRSLSHNPDVLWLRLPTQTAHGWTATLRGPDGNVLNLQSGSRG
ncbi:MAG: glyoxalase [Meiothermus sp.]